MSKKLDDKLIEIFEARNVQIELLKVAKVQVREVVRLGERAEKLVDQAERLAEKEGIPPLLFQTMLDEFEELNILDEEAVSEGLFEDTPKELSSGKFPSKLKKINKYLDDAAEEDEEEDEDADYVFEEDDD